MGEKFTCEYCGYSAQLRFKYDGSPSETAKSLQFQQLLIFGSFSVLVLVLGAAFWVWATANPGPDVADAGSDTANVEEAPGGIAESVESSQPKRVEEATRLPGRIVNSIGMPFIRLKVEQAQDQPASVYFGEFEVTQEEFRMILQWNPGDETDAPNGDRREQDYEVCRLPVVSVSSDAVRQFCKALSERAGEKEGGRSYRLPTEAEWEQACGEVAATFEAKAQAVDVESSQPNKQKLYGMHGNVSEWCSHGDTLKVRGRSFLHDDLADRVSDEPAAQDIGFRVVCVLAPSRSAEAEQALTSHVSKYLSSADQSIEESQFESARNLLDQIRMQSPEYTPVIPLLAKYEFVNSIQKSATEADEHLQRSIEHLDELEQRDVWLFKRVRVKFTEVFLARAKSHAVSGEFARAVKRLEQAEQAGFNDFPAVLRDDEFKSLLDWPELPEKFAPKPAPKPVPVADIAKPAPKPIDRDALEAKAQRKLGQAKNFRRRFDEHPNQKSIEARQHLKNYRKRLDEVIKDFPNTAAAAEAEKLLKKLGN